MPDLTRDETWELITHLRTVHGVTITPQDVGTKHLADYQSMHDACHNKGERDNA